jgi:hypothetical protein
MNWKKLKVTKYPPELQVPQSVLEWKYPEPMIDYKHKLENEEYVCEGCYVANGFLFMDHVRRKTVTP